MAPRTTRPKAGAAKAPAPTRRSHATSSARTPTAPQRRTPAKAKVNGTSPTKGAGRSSTEASTNKSGLPKLGKGGLEVAVLDHMATNPRSEYTPSDLARVLNRSGGAIANALVKFASQGKVVQTSERPRRYRHKAATAARRASARKR